MPGTGSLAKICSVAAVELWCAAAADAPLCAAWAAGHGFALHRQCDGDLGARMRHAVDSALARGERVLLIGTDCPALDADALGEAAAALADHDAVLVSAEDGGYVAIGFARAVDAFTGIAWSTADVAARTRAHFAAAAHHSSTAATLPRRRASCAWAKQAAASSA